MDLMNHTLSEQKKCCVGREEKKNQPVNGDGMWDQVCNRNNQRVTLMYVKLRPWVLTVHNGHRLGVIQPRHVCVVHLQQPNPKLIKNHSQLQKILIESQSYSWICYSFSDIHRSWIISYWPELCTKSRTAARHDAKEPEIKCSKQYYKFYCPSIMICTSCRENYRVLQGVFNSLSSWVQGLQMCVCVCMCACTYPEIIDSSSGTLIIGCCNSTACRAGTKNCDK
jgi:hypothetical protein